MKRLWHGLKEELQNVCQTFNIMKGKLKERENGHNTKELNYLKHTKRKNAMIFYLVFQIKGFGG